MLWFTTIFFFSLSMRLGQCYFHTTLSAPFFTKRFIPVNATPKNIIHSNCKPTVLLINRPNYSTDSQDIEDILQPKKTEGYDWRYKNDTLSESIDNIQKNFRLLHILQKIEQPSYQTKDMAIQFLNDHSEKSTYSPNLFDNQIRREFLEFTE